MESEERKEQKLEEMERFGSSSEVEMTSQRLEQPLWAPRHPSEAASKFPLKQRWTSLGVEPKNTGEEKKEDS